jgi:hypothetical protein
LEPGAVTRKLLWSFGLISVGDGQHVGLELRGCDDEPQVIEEELLWRGACFLERPSAERHRVGDIPAVPLRDRGKPSFAQLLVGLLRPAPQLNQGVPRQLVCFQVWFERLTHHEP